MSITTATHSHRVTPRAPRGGALGARWIGARRKKRPLKKFKTEHARRFRCAFLLEVGVGLRPPEVSPGALRRTHLSTHPANALLAPDRSVSELRHQTAGRVCCPSAWVLCTNRCMEASEVHGCCGAACKKGPGSNLAHNWRARGLCLQLCIAERNEGGEIGGGWRGSGGDQCRISQSCR